ncbi:NERD domain-containing protein [Microbacterium sp. KUDC0406]|uniref:nuclease-related domain-containing protein n=1 Tax=Microbacterium sp. KUDC0406 TaxID=2909588 RepID=UPI001F26B7C4|nr:nuclease-related domain-containing protein [Microbacterium sp. KUDC0406]UJP09439.1 NERD domain-containing protein [Microbacterium sp. KUDC0406]
MTTDSDGKRMRLRYAGHCRLCGAALPAGTDAVYERSTRSVRCLTCAPDEADAAEPGDADAETPADILRLRAPASAVIAETLRVQAGAPPRSRTARLFGVSPLSADAAPWFLGTLGELHVGRLLDELGPGWHVIHAIPVGSRGSDIDHLVIGPTGVFTINTKHHPGKVWVASRALVVNGQRTNHLRNAVHEAARASKLLSSAAQRRVPVTPVVAIVGARALTVREHPADVLVVRDTALRRTLRDRPTALSPAEVDALATIAAAPATWGSAEAPAPDLAAFAALRESVASARRRQRTWAVGGLLAIPTLLLAVSQLLPAALAVLAG